MLKTILLSLIALVWRDADPLSLLTGRERSWEN